MTDNKAFTLIAVLTTVAFALAIVMAFAAIDKLKQPASTYYSDYKDNPYN